MLPSSGWNVIGPTKYGIYIDNAASSPWQFYRL